MDLHAPYKFLLASAAGSVALGAVVDYPIIAPYPYGAITGIAGAAAGLWLGLWAKRVILAHDTTLNPFGEPSSLVTEGPFRFSRNPMYLSYVLVAASVALIIGSLASFIPPILYAMYLDTLIIPGEEEALQKNLRGLYERYRRRVRRWF